MAYSTQRAVSDGRLQLLQLTIKFFDKSEIAVLLDDVPTTAYTWATPNSIRLNAPAAVGVEVLIRRTTDISEVRHVFTAGAQFKDVTLDEDFRQILHIAQEAVEGSNVGDIYQDLDMHGYRIKNVGPAVHDRDAVSLGQVKAESTAAWAAANASAASANAAAASATRAETQANGANAHRIAAEASANAARGSATTAGASATAANAARDSAQAWASQLGGPVAGGLYSSRHYATEAATFAANAKASDSSALVQANRAKTEADRAKTEADKLGNMNDFASTLKSVDKSNKRVSWNDGYTLQVARVIVGDAGETQTVTVTPSGLTGPQSLTCTAGIDFNIAASTRNVNLDARAGLVTANAGALRVQHANPVFHMRSEAKMHAYLHAPGNGNFAVQTYAPDGTIGQPLNFNYQGNLVVPGTMRAADMLCTGGSTVQGNLVVQGNAVARGQYVMIQKVGGWIPFASTGAGYTTYNHNLGVVPTSFQLQLMCATAEHGYNVGDIITMSLGGYDGGNMRGIQILNANPNGVYIKISAQLAVITPRASATPVTVTAGRWNFRLISQGQAQG